MEKLPTQSVFGLDFVNGTVKDVADFLFDAIKKDKFLTVATPNPEQIVLASEQPEFAQLLQQFDIKVPDGHGIIWASQRQKKKLQSRIPGRKVVARLLITNREDIKILLVGGEGYHSAVLNPGFQIVPLTVLLTQVSWAKDFDRNKIEDTKSVLEWIKKNKPQIVFVALGAPYQEKWVIDHKDELEKAGVRVAMVVGGTFDTLTGKIKHTPEIFEIFKLEWLWRLIQEPWRWRRQVRLLKFIRFVFQKESK